MSHADKRSPVTDALETLGMIHFKPEARDAIHLAVEPVIADSILAPGQKIGIIEGYAIPVGATYNTGVLDAEGKVGQITMKSVSPLADFSYDYQDLLLTPVAGK